MIDLADALKGDTARLLPKAGGASNPAPRRVFTMQGLKRATLWGATAAGALFIAVMATRGDIAPDRIALLLHGHPKQVAAQPFDARAETRRLAEELRGLAASDEQIKSRLAAVEHDMDDITGSITKEIKAADAQRVDDGPSLTATATASMAAPVDLASTARVPDPFKASADTALPPPTRTVFGVDIGSGLTVQALRMRWNAIRVGHAKLFEHLEPVVSVKDIPHSNRIELRLVAGPIAQPAAATELCASLARAGLFCQPTIYDGQHLVLR